MRAFEVTPRGAEIFLRFGSEEALENGKERVISILPVENGIVAYKVTETLKSLEEYKSFRVAQMSPGRMNAASGATVPVVRVLTSVFTSRLFLYFDSISSERSRILTIDVEPSLCSRERIEPVQRLRDKRARGKPVNRR